MKYTLLYLTAIMSFVMMPEVANAIRKVCVDHYDISGLGFSWTKIICPQACNGGENWDPYYGGGGTRDGGWEKGWNGTCRFRCVCKN